MSELRTIEQDRIAAALRAVSRLDKAKAAEYKKEAAGFGPLVVANGLAGAIAFVSAKGKTDLAKHLDEWICSRKEFERLGGRRILEKAGDKGCDAGMYRAMTRECLAYLNWLKRLAEARVKGD